jgi:hypothetical protein
MVLELKPEPRVLGLAWGLEPEELEPELPELRERALELRELGPELVAQEPEDKPILK